MQGRICMALGRESDGGGVGELIKQMARFSVVGLTAFGIDIGLTVVFVELFHLDHVVATVISYLLSTVFNYCFSMRFVFERRTDISRRRQFNIFVALSAVGLILNELVMVGGESLLTAVGIDYNAGYHYVVVKTLATMAVAVWNFYSRRRWLDKNAREARIVMKRERLANAPEKKPAASGLRIGLHSARKKIGRGLRKAREARISFRSRD